ncbi:hypothetical protein HUT18_07050 [Streptomyces sp. NA04227]|uniref:hypothetical protein n=1 Tax=Streptomyces sp. NA04227 TaxID=2742136 RepID=UPI0015905BEE|nr:hypothetical protein [Streptomyces sp. NA04227]QKW06196.1 hypothetical protein HUT18_07050 [Streptomyces sp. NA04227]
MSGATVPGGPAAERPVPGVLVAEPEDDLDAVRAADGRATAITALTPIKLGRTPLLRLLLVIGARVKMLREALETLSFIHYARWTIIKEFPYNGAPQRKEKLRYDYLFFETNFNGTWDEYIDAFSGVIPERMQAIWGFCVNFPGPRPVGPFKEYIHKNDLPIAHYYAAYPEATTTTVISALAVQDKLADFQARTVQLTDPEQFRRAYEEFLTDVQHHL